MENKEVFVTLGFDRAGNLVEYRREGIEVPLSSLSADAALSSGPSSDVPPPAQGAPGGPGGPPRPGSDPCLVRLPSGQLIRVC